MNSANLKTKKAFFFLMKNIEDETQKKVEIIKLSIFCSDILNLCMTFRDYTLSALKYNSDAHVYNISLPLSMSEHQMLMSHEMKDSRVSVQYLDITMLSTEFEVIKMSQDHSERAKFLIDQHSYSECSFNLVFCNRQVLQTQALYWADYHEQNEATWLSCSQLILALNWIKPGGTLIMLLHKVEARSSMTLLDIFDKISDVVLFKPKKIHATRSSFYLVARNVRSQDPWALSAIATWKNGWKVATFAGMPNVAGSDLLLRADQALKDANISLLLDFGEWLIELGDPIWNLQMDALAKAPWLRQGHEDEPPEGSRNWTKLNLMAV